MPEYDPTPSGEIRRIFAAGRFGIRDDAADAVDRIITTADLDRPPLRLVIGDMAFDHIERALADRLEAVRTQKAAV
ncbi:hypothetical protein [Sphingomonas bacterium]|uniref:hypothetical protein n=1 Tax=Sphingomonas bacterium TaxID=1895847 RepID=UPI0020C606FA|nr:hypothetical protein [Sphingomonas bacterium]